MKQHGLHAAVVRQVHADLGLPYILLCSIQPRLVDDLSDIALWLEELVLSHGSEAPRSKTYSVIFSNDEFMMFKGLYHFQLYSLH